MKKKKKIIITLIIVAAIISLVIGLLFIFRDKNKYTFYEKNWINSNIKNISNVNVINNVSLFGEEGEGIFYSFLEDFKNDVNIELNPVVTSKFKNDSELSFNITKYEPANSLIFYKDHYVILTNTKEKVKDIYSLTNKKVGVIKSDLNHIYKNINNDYINFVTFKDKNNLLDAFNSKDENKIEYIAVPLNEYIKDIISNDYDIAIHLGDIKKYYSLKLPDDKTFASILKKYFNKWKDEKFSDYYNEFNRQLFLKNLSIESKDIDILTKKTYNYGFIKQAPYELIKSGNYGGIVSTYLKKFSDFSEVEFKFKEYKNQDKLKEAINNGNIDLYYNYYSTKDNYSSIDSIYYINYSILAPKNNYEVINSLDSLSKKQVYVLENSILERKLKEKKNITIKTYKNDHELLKINNPNAYIVLDTFTYYNYANKLNKYILKYSDYLDQTYTFKLNGDAILYKLMNSYYKTLDPKEIAYNGYHNYQQTYKHGTLISRIAKYLLVILFIIIIIIIVLYKYTKKIKIQKKIKKDDKIRFIDELTSLKNRNYLNENMSEWDKNTIYPQTIIIIDLNDLKDLNDKYGHVAGDKQIQALANILIKTQLDNSDIIRSDGNEFIIYLVGYTERQIASYMRKLNKEFKNLPYEKSASMGYSMIKDDLKLIDDAINEATIDMKKKKESVEE